MIMAQSKDPVLDWKAFSVTEFWGFFLYFWSAEQVLKISKFFLNQATLESVSFDIFVGKKYTF